MNNTQKQLVKDLVDKHETHDLMAWDISSQRYNLSDRRINEQVKCIEVEYYKNFELIPKQHSDVYLAHHNDCADVEFKDCFGNWIDAELPIWKIGTDYRLLPQPKPQPTSIELPQEAIELLTNSKSSITSLKIYSGNAFLYHYESALTNSLSPLMVSINLKPKPAIKGN